MKKKICMVIALLLCICIILPSCGGNSDKSDDTTVQNETEKIKETEAETETEAEETTEVPETEAETEAEETETEAPETDAPETEAPASDTPAVNPSQGDVNVDVDVSVDVNGNVSGGGSGSTSGGNTGTQNPSVPDGYVMTDSGKLLVHTVSDRSTDPSEDNSTNLSFFPLKISVEPDWHQDYNRPKTDLATMRPGTLAKGVLRGYDDYYFYQDTLNDFIGQGILSSSIYDRTVQTLRERNNWAESHGKKFIS